MPNRSRGLNVVIETNADEVADVYDEIAGRTRHLEPVLKDVMGLLIADERSHFAKMRGRYVRSSATRQSLTQREAAGAIRDIHGDGLEFGTGIEYAHWLTKRRRDRDNEQVRKPDGKGRSAVLVFKRATKRKAATMILDYVTRPFGEGP